MERDGDSPPIRSTPSTPFVPVRRRSRQFSVFVPVTLTIAFFVLLMFIIFLISPTVSRNNQVLKPTSSVKKSWNSIYLFFVLFAVLCGVFSRKHDGTSSSDGAETPPINAYEIVDSGRRSVSGADHWLEYLDRKAYAKTSSYMNSGGNRLRRNSSSYPDLKQESLLRSDGEKFRSFDDFEVDFHRPPGNFHRHDRQSHEVEKDFVVGTTVREIPVEKFELKKSVPPPPRQPVSQGPQPPPPPPPPPVKRRRSVHSVAKQYNDERGGREAEFNEKRSPVSPPSKTPTPPPPPPPPPQLKFHPLPERREIFQRKKSGPTKEFATAIVSLYQVTQGKRKNRSKSRYIFESVAQNSPPTVPAPSPIPSVPPPPPPPPPSKNVLQNLFKKSSKGKRVHSISTANPPPPPPPPPPRTPSSIFNNIFKTGSKSKRFQLTSAASQSPPPPPPPPPSTIFNSLFKNEIKIQRLKYIETQPPPPTPPPLPTTPRSRQKHSPASTVKPPKPTKPSTSHHESVVIAPASPLIPMPPPPPPFKMPELKFIKKGDFVRISSANSSRCSSPGREDFDVMSVKSDGGDSTGPPFTCPSPDVDSKADTFISKRRDEWRLEKINSLKEQRNTGSRSARLG